MRLSDLERRVLLSALGFTKRHFDYDIANRDIFPVSYDKLTELFVSFTLEAESGLDATRRPVCLRLDAPELQLLEDLLCDRKTEDSQQQLAVRKLLLIGEDWGRPQMR